MIAFTFLLVRAAALRRYYQTLLSPRNDDET